MGEAGRPKDVDQLHSQATCGRLMALRTFRVFLPADMTFFWLCTEQHQRTINSQTEISYKHLFPCYTIEETCTALQTNVKAPLLMPFLLRSLQPDFLFPLEFHTINPGKGLAIGEDNLQRHLLPPKGTVGVNGVSSGLCTASLESNPTIFAPTQEQWAFQRRHSVF